MSLSKGHMLVHLICFIALMSGISAVEPAVQTVRVVSRVEEPLVFVRKEGGKKVVDGFVKDVVDKMGSILNVNFEMTTLSNGSLEAQTTDMLNQLGQGTVDVIGPLSITFVNVRSFDFTKPILSTGIVPVWNPTSFSKEGDSLIFSWLPINSRIFLILKPLSAGVWLLSLFCFVGVSVFFYLIYRFNPRERIDNSVIRTYDDEFSILGSFLFAFSCLVWQGYSRAPRSISGRVLAAFWWIFGLILICCYIAKLVFFLTPTALVASSSNNDDTGPELKNLVGKEGVTFGVVKNSQEYYFFRQSRVKVYEDMWKSMNENPTKSFLASSEEGFEKTRDGGFVFLTSSLMANYAIGRGDCNLEQLGSSLTSTGVGFALKPGSPLKDKISLAILELNEQGEIRKLRQKWWKSECSDKPNANYLASQSTASIPRVSVTDFAGAFILLVIGAILAAIVLLLEILFTRRRKRKELQIQEKKPEETVMVETSADTPKV